MTRRLFSTLCTIPPISAPRTRPSPVKHAGPQDVRLEGEDRDYRYAEELGFDWVSVSEHHYSPRILTPSLPIH